MNQDNLQEKIITEPKPNPPLFHKIMEKMIPTLHPPILEITKTRQLSENDLNFLRTAYTISKYGHLLVPVFAVPLIALTTPELRNTDTILNIATMLMNHPEELVNPFVGLTGIMLGIWMYSVAWADYNIKRTSRLLKIVQKRSQKQG